MCQAQATIQLSREHDFTFFMGLGTVFHGWALAELGDLETGIGLMRQGVGDAVKTGARIGMPHMLGMLAEAYGKIGQPQEGLTLTAEALVMANDSAERHYEAELHRLRGELLLQANGIGSRDAHTSFQLAITIARAQGAKSLELRAITSLARNLSRNSLREQARVMLGDMYNWFQEGHNTPDLAQARALLVELKSSPPRIK